MSERLSQSTVARLAKALYRRVPEAFQRKIKNVISEDFPSQSVKESSQPDVAAQKKLKPNSNKIQVLPEDVGTTYDPDVVFPMLALENNVLHQQLRANQNEIATLRHRLVSGRPDGTLKGSSVPELTASTLAEKYLAGQPQGSPRHLVLVNDYPREGNHTTNKGVHQRVKNYKAAGVAVDVVCAGESLHQEFYEFDDVRVLTGRGQEIAEVLKRQSYTSVSVHCLNEHIWSPLEPFLPELAIHVFMHGRETFRWVRKLETYKSGKQLEEAIEQSIATQHFWQKVLNHPYQPKSYIFRSDWWRRAVSDDLLTSFPGNQVVIIRTNRDPRARERSGQGSVKDQELSILGLGD